MTVPKKRSSFTSGPRITSSYEPESPSVLLKKGGVMSSASVRYFRSLTQKPEQSKLTNPHCVSPLVIVEAYEEGVWFVPCGNLHRESLRTCLLPVRDSVL